MPTGYTAKLYEGEQSFEEYALGVARAFGALIEMRDEAQDATIPEQFEPSSHHREAAERAREDIAAAEAWTDREAAERELGLRHEAEQRHAAYKRKRDERRARYEAMLEKARAYVEPTPDHEKFACYLVEQLEESIEFDCGGDYLPDVSVPRSAAQFRADEIAKAKGELDYHEAEYRKAAARAEQRTAWVRALRDSLGVGASA